MALNIYRFAYDNEKLNWLLHFSLSVVVSDDLDRFDMPGMVLNLDLLYANRGVGHEACIEFDFLPHGNGVENMPVDFVVVSYRDCKPGEEEAGLYAYSEFARGLYMELRKQSEGDDVRRENAMKFIQKYNLQKYADA